MVSLTSLCLPILLSAVAVFIASSIIHMVLPYHRGDYKKVPQEDAVMDALRKFGIPAGDYMMPRAESGAAMKSPEFKEKLARGPVALITVITGDMGMGRRLLQWFVYLIVVSTFAGYVASRALGPGAAGASVCRFASTVAFVGYGLGLWQNSICYSRSWVTTLKSNFDSLIYAFLTGWIFAWLWPAA